MSESPILDRAAAAQRERRLEYFTIAWNEVEGLLAVALDAIAGSISLVGFGLDSFIELMSGTVLLWRMSVDADVARRELNDRRALRIVGICFLLLAVYITYESADLIFKRAPKHSLPGIIFGVCFTCGDACPFKSKAKSRERIEQCGYAGRCQANRFLRLFVCHSCWRISLESTLQLLVGRPCGSAFDGAAHRKRRNRSPAL